MWTDGVQRERATIEIVVNARWQRKGIGTKLASRAIKYVRSRKMIPAVYMHNDPAIKFWRSVGLDSRHSLFKSTLEE